TNGGRSYTATRRYRSFRRRPAVPFPATPLAGSPAYRPTPCLLSPPSDASACSPGPPKLRVERRNCPLDALRTTDVRFEAGTGPGHPHAVSPTPALARPSRLGTPIVPEPIGKDHGAAYLRPPCDPHASGRET